MYEDCYRRFLASGQTARRPRDSRQPCEDRRQWANAANPSPPVIPTVHTFHCWICSVTGDRMCSVYASWGWACYAGQVHAACMISIPAGWPHLHVALPAAGRIGCLPCTCCSRVRRWSAFIARPAANKMSTCQWTDGLTAVCTISYTFSRPTIIVCKNRAIDMALSLTQLSINFHTKFSTRRFGNLTSIFANS